MAVKVSRIEKEFVLKQLLDNRLGVEIQFSNTRVEGILEQIREKEKELVFIFKDSPPEALPQVPHVDLYIPFRGAKITCRVGVRKCDQMAVWTMMPDALYRDLDRGFERVELGKDVSVSFLMEGVEYRMDFPETGEYFEPEPPSVNIKFDARKITRLLAAFRAKAASFSSENRIVMFRERRPESLPERILAWTGRPLLLPVNDNRLVLATRENQGIRVLEMEEISTVFKQSGSDPLVLSQEFSKIIESNLRRGIHHELYSPVLFQQYVVGYVYLMRAGDQQGHFGINILEFVNQFTRLLAYSLQQNDYFQASAVRKTFDRSVLVDVSASGLLFSMPVNSPALELYTDLDLRVAFPSRSLEIRGRVMRKYQDQNRIYIGIKFLELADPDYEFLLEQLYGGKTLDPFAEAEGPD